MTSRCPDTSGSAFGQAPRMLQRQIALLFAALLFTACNTKDQAPAPDPMPAPPAPPPQATPALQAAHTAYLEGDFLAMTERIRDVLVDPASSDLARENAFELLDMGYETNKGKLPSRDVLPPGFTLLRYDVTRWQSPHGSSFRIHMRGRAQGATRVANVVVKRLPDQIVFDKASKRGQFRTENEEPGMEDFVIDTGHIDVLPADGVYTVHIDREDGSSWDSWFIGRSLAPTASPELVTPAALPISFSDPNPKLVWKPFRSPQYRPFEHRTLGIYVSKEPTGGTAWDYWTGAPGEIGEVRIGDHPDATKTKLAPGEYWMMLSGGEERTFGPLRVGRGGSTVGSFHVVP